MRLHVLGTATVGLALGLMLLPRPAAAQSTMAGVVTDATGAVLPGVTVEAASPALIEKVRSVVTNADGRYSIINLRPGVYVMTFTLPGFSTVRREGIEVAANVTVPVNAELRVGALEETVIVSGATPVVDIQQAAQRQVLSREVLDALPTARTYLSTGVLMPTVKITRPDMGGIVLGQGAYLSSRGKSSNEDAVEIDGLDVRISNGVSQSGYNNFAMVQDVTYQTSAIGVDSSPGGVRINMIPREGGSTFAGDFYLGGSTSSWQSNNITPELKARGLPSPESLDYLIEATPSIGGPILRDKLWFFSSGRYNQSRTHPAGARYRDGRPAFTLNALHMLSSRLTWQPTPRNKVTAYIDKSFKSQDETVFFTLGMSNPAGVDWETATSTYDPSNFQLGYVKWTSPVSSRLLVETGFAFNTFNTHFGTYNPGISKPRGTPDWYAGAARQDLVLGTLRGAPGVTAQYAYQPSWQFSSSASYVTGSHSFKAGVQYRLQRVRFSTYGGNADLVQRYRTGVPDSVSVAAVPWLSAAHADEVGVYAMDSWTIGRLTVSPGIRFEYFTGQVDASASSSGRFVPLRTVEAFSPVDPFFDVVPRFGVAYDLFGNAKTALKFSASRYVAQLSGRYFFPYNPISMSSDVRNWFDTDLTPGTSTPSGRHLPTNGDDIAQDNEIGPSNDRRFGLAADRRVAPNLEREYNWDYSASIQHELMPRVSASAGWYYTRNYDTQRTSNTLRGVSDYTPFQATNPLTSEPVTIFNLNRAKQGLVDRVDTNSDINRRFYTGYEASVQARLSNAGMVLVGWAMEQIRDVTCDTEDPNNFRFCDQTGKLHQDLGQVADIPYRHEFKAAGSYPLPGGIQGGVSFLSYPGGALTVSWLVPPALFPGGRTESVTIPLIPPGTKFLKRWNQLDVSVKRIVRVAGLEIQPTVEVFNLLNSSVVLGELQTFGSALGRPTLTLQGRFLKLSGLVKF